MNPLSRVSLFSGVNKYLFLCLIVFLGILGYLLFMNTSSPSDGTIQQIPSPTPANAGKPLQAPKELAAANSIKNPLNKLLFDQVKSQMEPGETLISEGRMHGKVLSIGQQGSDYVIELASYIPSMKLEKIWYVYPQAWMSKIKVYEGEEQIKPLVLADIKTGDEIFIHEKNDYSKLFPESIMSITIHKLVPKK